MARQYGDKLERTTPGSYLIFSSELEIDIKVFFGEKLQKRAHQWADHFGVHRTIPRILDCLSWHHGTQAPQVFRELWRFVARLLDELDIA